MFSSCLVNSDKTRFITGIGLAFYPTGTIFGPREYALNVTSLPQEGKQNAASSQ
jgi:hypothetical protein